MSNKIKMYVDIIYIAFAGERQQWGGQNRYRTTPAIKPKTLVIDSYTVSNTRCEL